MAHAAKYKSSQLNGLLGHYERAKDDEGNYHKHANEDIDSARSHLNYNLAPDHGMTQRQFIKKRCSEVKCQNRADVNVMCSWVVTAPKDLPESDHKRFFEYSYKFLIDRYDCEDSVISSYVHLDETSDHMHFAFVPVVEDKKKGGLKVSAKECINRRDLNTFHSDFTDYLADPARFGYDVGVQTGLTEQNLTAEELKARTEALAELEARETAAAATEERLNARESDLNVREGILHAESEENALHAKQNAVRLELIKGGEARLKDTEAFISNMVDSQPADMVAYLKSKNTKLRDGSVISHYDNFMKLQKDKLNVSQRALSANMQDLLEKDLEQQRQKYDGLE